MRSILWITAAVAALALPGAAAAQNGKGEGKGGGNGRGQVERGPDRGDGDRGRGRGQERAERRDDRGPRRDRGEERRWERAEARVQPSPGNRGRDDRDDDGRWDEREVRRAVRDGSPVVVLRDAPRAVYIQGCPPGLAKKDNGCLPPGQARRIVRDRAWDDWYWSRNRDDGRWRYEDGYVYRIADGGGVAGWLPVLGGALGLGAVWPQQYQFQPAPDYYTDYWRLNEPYDWRYADGVIYGVDPQTQAISAVAALLTGQQWTVGQAMPAGYDVYNVPYAYRDRYVDGPARWYRYSDGHVYQVDPTTRLVQAVIQLLV